MTSRNLKSETKKGVYWSAASNLANQGMRFIFSIILARLLSPNDYGIIGMLTIFIIIVQLFVDSGFSKAIITKQERTQTDLSTAFYFNIVVGILGYFLLFISSPFIASFYDMPILSPILKIIGLGVILNSLNILPTALFAIRLDFKTPAIVSVTSNIFTGVLGIYLAYIGWGVWALVFQTIGGNLLTLLLNWLLIKWKPSLKFSKDSFIYLWRFGSKVLASSFISTIYDNIQPLIIGKFFSATSLGLFSRAQGFATLPSSNLSGVLNSVTFPILSKINDNIEHLAVAYRRLLRMTAFIVFPLMIGLAALSEPVVKVLLPERWYDCIPMMKILCLSLIWQPISAVNLNLLNAAKRPDMVLRLELIKKPLGLVLLFSSLPFGIISLCMANLTVCVFSVVINTIMTSKVLHVKFNEQIKDLLPILINSIVMGLIVYLTTFIPTSMILIICIGFGVGFLYYVVSSRIFMSDLWNDTLYIIKRTDK